MEPGHASLDEAIRCAGAQRMPSETIHDATSNSCDHCCMESARCTSPAVEQQSNTSGTGKIRDSLNKPILSKAIIANTANKSTGAAASPMKW
eukprot:6209440-Pleurochrysis_carterae.AAC.1